MKNQGLKDPLLKNRQAYIIRKALNNGHLLPFNSPIRFVTSELALFNKSGRKVVTDIIGYNIPTKQIAIIELKSQRHLKKLIEQVRDFELIIQEHFPLFMKIFQLHGLPLKSATPIKAIVWPDAMTNQRMELKAERITECTYKELGESIEIFV